MQLATARSIPALLAPHIRWPRWSRVAAVVATVGLAVVVLAGVQILHAREHLLAGAGSLARVDGALVTTGGWETARARERTQQAVLQAHREFAGARSDLSPWSPVLDRLGWLPRYGAQLSAAAPAADAAYYSTDAALHLMQGLTPLWPVLTPTHGRSRTLALAVAALQAGNADFKRARSDAERAGIALQRLPRNSGLAALDNATRRLRRRLPQLQTVATWLGAAPVMLGASEPGSYLIALQDPAELRATGGFIGATAFATVSRGALRVVAGSSALPHEIRSIPPPLPEALYTPEGSWIFRDANWSPDFPLSARLERWFYGEDTGRWADGVINVQETAIPALLRATGPVYVRQYGRWVGTANVHALADRYVNGTYHGPIRRGAADTVRKQFFRWVLSALVPRLQSIGISRLQELGAVLGDAVSRREIQIYDRRPAVEAAIRASGADGHFGPVPGDFLSIVDDNRSYNKLNPYVRESASYDITVLPTRELDARLSVRYHVDRSPANLEGMGPGGGVWGSKHDYLDFLRVYVPAGSHLESVTGIDGWAPAPAYGLTQLAGRLLVRSGQTSTAIFHYRVPAEALGPASSPYRLTVRRQPGARLPSLRVSLRGAAGVSLSGGKNPFARSIPLLRDAHLTVPVAGTRTVSRISAPGATATTDPYVPLSFFHDPRHPL